MKLEMSLPRQCKESCEDIPLGARNHVILHLMSTFPPLTETFVMREIRQLRAEGWPIAIAELRPLHNTPPANGFDDLVAVLCPAKWVSLDLFMGILFCCVLRTEQVWSCFKLISRAKHQPRCVLKMLYVLASSMRLAFRFRKHPPALLRAHFLHNEALAARFVSLLLNIPYALTVYTAEVLYPEAVIREVVQHATFVIADTYQVRDYLRNFGVEVDSEYVIHNSVDIAEFPARSIQQTKPLPTILAVGRLDAKKGFDTLVVACSILQQRGIDFHCVIVGDGAERDHLIAAKRRFALDDRVEMPGKLGFSEVRNWYYKSQIFAMPSVVTSSGETDGLPTVVIEAMASGLPVVGARTAGIPEAVRDGVNGFLVPGNDPEGLADRLSLLIERQDLRERLGNAGRRIAEAEFDLTRKSKLLSTIILRHLQCKV